MSTVQNFANAFCRRFAKEHTTYIIFDIYLDDSRKSHERTRRAAGKLIQKHVLTSESPLPCREVIMRSSQIKQQLIKTLCDTPHGNPLLHLVGEGQCLFHYEDPDVNSISYMLHLQKNTCYIQIKADDTDIFLLSVYNLCGNMKLKHRFL